MALVAALLEILQRSTFVEVLSELVMFMAPIWIAVVVGVLVGWAWKPKWANLAPEYASAPSSLMLLQNLSSGFASISILNPIKFHSISGIKETPTQDSLSFSQSSSSQLEGDKTVVTDADLRYLDQLVEEQDGGHPWIQMMDRSTSNMSYQAWRRDPEAGPPQYRSRTIYEDATPEMVRDFFWDDEFRLKWDDMHVHAETLEDCPTTGTMMVQWVRKFPFFCSDREYIIGRRIWKSGLVYYCVTKGVPCSSVPRRNKPRRVDLYYSSWCIRAAESKRDGRMTATEVLLFHYEDMGIPWEIAKLGVRQGMWGAVRKIDHGLRAYQKHRDSEDALSRSANLAQVHTKVDIDTFRSLGFRSPGSGTDVSEIETEDSPQKPVGRNIPRCLVVGGAIALACSIDRGLLTKAVIFGVARKFAGIGKRL